MAKHNNVKTSPFLHNRQSFFFFAFLFFACNVTAQFRVTVRLTSVPPGHQNDVVFIAGSFNGWNPAQQSFVLQNNNLVTELNGLSAGKVEFKFTRGNWDKVECTGDGKDVANHEVFITNDTTLIYSVNGWKDDFNSAVTTHTASANVQVIDTAFEMPALKRYRRIWIYLPPGYKNNRKHYPVMYLQDGQNLFDKATSAYGEWGVDECLDSLIAAGKPGCIVVGIDHGGTSRMSEYNPFEFTWKNDSASQTFAAEGNAYVEFIIHTLKPFIDKKFRTIPSKENTIIAGSSMGGLIAYYASLKYPGVFGKAGIFSPAFWTASGIDTLTDSLAGKLRGKYFFYMGGKEGADYMEDMLRIQEKIGKRSGAMVYSFIDTGAQHNELAWRKWFAEFYNWSMADGFNVITGGLH